MHGSRPSSLFFIDCFGQVFFETEARDGRFEVKTIIISRVSPVFSWHATYTRID
jgi:hypothetical protein